MALSTKVGSFSQGGTTGNLSITGVGFTPKAIVFWFSGSQSASGAWDPDVAQSVGYTTGASNSYAVGGFSWDGQTTPQASRRIAAAIYTVPNKDGSTVWQEATLASLDADGFTINRTVSDANFQNQQVNYLALGGTDITSAKVVNWTTPTATGNKAVTGVGFKPDLVLHAGSDISGAVPATSSTANELIFGAMNKHGQQWANTFVSMDASAVSNSDTQRAQQTDACYISITNGLAVFEQAHYVSMDTDGFTTNFSTASATAYNAISLCLKGVSSKLGAFSSTTTSTAPVAQSVSRVGFQSKAVLASWFSDGASSGAKATAYWGVGAATSSSEERSAGLQDMDALSTTDTASSWRSDAFILQAGGGANGNDWKVAELTQFTADGFDINWTLNNSSTSASEVLYLALGDSGTDTSPVFIDTSTTSTATAYSNQRKVDRCQNGVLWTCYREGSWLRLRYSDDDGKTWNAATSVALNGTTYTANFSLFIDLDDYAHIVYKDGLDGYIYYRRGTPNAGRTAWTWSSALQVGNSADVDRNYPDIVAHREGSGWKAHIVVGYATATGPANYIDYIRLNIAASGTVSSDTFTQNSNNYAVNMQLFPSIDFNHIGDGKTVAGGTPHLYVAWSAGATGAGKGIRFRRGKYESGTWNWSPTGGGEKEIDTTRYINTSNRWLNCMFDGTAVIMVGMLHDGTNIDIMLYERDAADTTTTTKVLHDNASPNDYILYSGSATYDQSRDVYLFGTTNEGSGTSRILYRKWDRSADTFSGPTITDTAIDSAAGYTSAKRGYPNNRIEWVYTSGNNSPYAVKYDYLATGGSNPTVTLSSPADGASADLSTGPTFSWSFSDADSETQASYALRRRVQGTTEYEYWNATTVGWQAVLIYNSSTTASVTFPADWWQGGTIYEWSVSVKDTGGATSAFAADRTVTNSAARSGVKTKVGSFTKINTVTTQAITGLGFRPKAIIFWTSGSDAASGAWDPHVAQIIGFATANEEYAASGVSESGIATSNTSQRLTTKAITRPNAAGSATFYEADLNTMDTDGFTLNWTTNTTESTVISYLALGGDDITAAKVVQWTGPSADNTAQPVTGVGFKPDLVFHISNMLTTLGTSAGTEFIFGAMNKHGQQWSNCIHSFDNSPTTTNTQRGQQTDACLYATTSGQAIDKEAHYQSMDSDGFTVFFSNAGGARITASLCIKGVSSKLGALTKATGAAPVSQAVTGAGFTPKAVVFSTFQSSALASPATHSMWGMGASDGTNERAVAQQDQDGASTVNANSILYTDKAIAYISSNTGPTIGAVADLQSFDSDGFTLNWTTNNTDQTEILYMTLGDNNISTVPQFIDSSTENQATGYANQRKLDRTQNGNLWATFWNGTSTTTASMEFWYSTDGGATWTEDTAGRLGFSGTGTTHTPDRSFFIDLDDNAHLVYHDRNDGFLYYRRGTPNAGRTSWTWSSANVVYNGGAGFAQYADVVAHRDPAGGGGWYAHIIWGMDNATTESSYVRYRLVTITFIGGISLGTVETLTPAASNNTNQRFPSIDFHHTGDGKTVKDGLPHLYAAWSTGTTGVGFGIRFRKATYSAGPTWTWGANVEIDNSMYVLDATSGYWLNCLFDGTAVIIGGALWTGAAPAKLRLWQRDAGDSTTTPLYTADGTSMAQWWWGSLTYDHNRNIYVVSTSNGSSPYNLAYRKWTRTSDTTGTLGSNVELDARMNATYSALRRGYYGSVVEAVYTHGNNSPYSVKYISLSTTGGTTTERWGQVHV